MILRGLEGDFLGLLRQQEREGAQLLPTENVFGTMVEILENEIVCVPGLLRVIVWVLIGYPPTVLQTIETSEKKS